MNEFREHVLFAGNLFELKGIQAKIQNGTLLKRDNVTLVVKPSGIYIVDSLTKVRPVLRGRKTPDFLICISAYL